VTWDIERNAVGSPSVTEGTAYPSPFLLNQQSAVYIPANATEGDLTIYSSGMGLVYHAHQQLTSRAGQTVFVWMAGLLAAMLQIPAFMCSSLVSGTGP